MNQIYIPAKEKCSQQIDWFLELYLPPLLLGLADMYSVL